MKPGDFNNMWILQSAKTRDDPCVIVYSQTTQDDDGDDVVEYRTVKHHKLEDQTEGEWHLNLGIEISTAISNLNKVHPPAVDITRDVRPS